ncbi:hypothetical protein ACIBSV_42320 [Embleya sp. NPDC050154]|uniref:hypothetical protein n=1 Tax=Embleya sp. NPDC050154 TaxID=3363988 RepID=UPI0037B4055A
MTKRTQEFTNDEGVTCRAVMTEEAAARPDEEHRAMYRRLLATHRPPDPAMEPINCTLNTTLNAFVLERLEGLHTPATTSASTTSHPACYGRTWTPS